MPELYLWFFMAEGESIDHCLIVTKTYDQQARNDTYQEACDSMGVGDVALMGVAKLLWIQGDGVELRTDHGHVG